MFWRLVNNFLLWLAKKSASSDRLMSTVAALDYDGWMKKATDPRVNQNFATSLPDLMKKNGVPMATKVLVDMVTLHISQLETSTFVVKYGYSAIPIKTLPEGKTLFLGFSLHKHYNEKRKTTHYLDDVYLVISEGKQGPQGVARSLYNQNPDAAGKIWIRLVEEELDDLTFAICKLLERNDNWEKLKKDSEKEKAAIQVIEAYLGIPETKPKQIENKRGDRESNPFDEAIT